MTVSTTSRSMTHTGNGSATAFAFAFPVYDADHLEVILTVIATGVETVLNSTQYNVSGIGSLSGGSVTYPKVGSPIAATHQLTIRRTMPYTQVLDLSNQNAFQPDVLEETFDRLVMMMQQLAPGEYPVSSPDDSVRYIEKLTQAEYNALTSPDPQTLYVIVG